MGQRPYILEQNQSLIGLKEIENFQICPSPEIPSSRDRDQTKETISCMQRVEGDNAHYDTQAWYIADERDGSTGRIAAIFSLIALSMSFLIAKG